MGQVRLKPFPVIALVVGYRRGNVCRGSRLGQRQSALSLLARPSSLQCPLGTGKAGVGLLKP